MDAVKNRNGMDKKLYELCLPVVREQGYVLYDLEYLSSQKLLRLYIMDEVTKSAVIEDCVKVDHALTPVFEANDWIPAEIVLEVGSPGVYRHVNTLAHFQLGLGETHSVTITGNLEGATKKVSGAKKFRGVLLEASPTGITLGTVDGEVSIPLNQIKNAGLDPDFNELMQKATPAGEA
jgi:ribosome maturation factor RimP